MQTLKPRSSLDTAMIAYYDLSEAKNEHVCESSIKIGGKFSKIITSIV